MKANIPHVLLALSSALVGWNPNPIYLGVFVVSACAWAFSFRATEKNLSWEIARSEQMSKHAVELSRELGVSLASNVEHMNKELEALKKELNTVKLAMQLKQL